MKLNQLTTNPATVKELLKDNPKAMQFLHRQCAFDFCKPFEVVKTCGAFTLNSVKKAINAETLDNLNIYILLKCFARCGSLERDFHAALRAERAKADYLQRDLTEETEKTREELQKAAREAGEQLSAASLECDFERTKECCDKLRWAAWSLNRHDTKAAAKDFASVEAFFKSLDGIRKDIDTARKYLEPIQPADVHAIAARELPPDHIDHHESDLYIKFSAKSRALMLRLSCKSLLTTFKSQIDGATWYELPMCYNPAIGAGDR